MHRGPSSDPSGISVVRCALPGAVDFLLIFACERFCRVNKPIHGWSRWPIVLPALDGNILCRLAEQSFEALSRTDSRRQDLDRCVGENVDMGQDWEHRTILRSWPARSPRQRRELRHDPDRLRGALYVRVIDDTLSMMAAGKGGH